TVLAAVATRSGSAPRITHRINDFHVAEAMVAAGHGISLLPRYTSGRGPGVRLVPLAGGRAGRRLAALARAARAARLGVRHALAELTALAAELDGRSREAVAGPVPLGG